MARNLFIAALIGGVLLSFYGEDKPAVATPMPIESTSQVTGLQAELDSLRESSAAEMESLREQLTAIQADRGEDLGKIEDLHGKLEAMKAQAEVAEEVFTEPQDESEYIEPEATTLTVASGVCAQGSCGPSYSARSYSTQRVGLFGLRSRSSGRWYLGKNLGRGRLLGRIFRR
jgi:hypothetical protein